MCRRTKLAVAFTFMVTVVVACSSCIYISQILHQQIFSTRDTAFNLTSRLAYLANVAAPDLSSARVDTDDPEAVRRAIAYYLSADHDLNGLVESVAGTWPTVYDAAMVDADGKAILHSNAELIGKSVTDRPDFQGLQDAPFQDQLRRHALILSGVAIVLSLVLAAGLSNLALQKL
jgi:hypothetical protein